MTLYILEKIGGSLSNIGGTLGRGLPGREESLDKPLSYHQAKKKQTYLYQKYGYRTRLISLQDLRARENFRKQQEKARPHSPARKVGGQTVTFTNPLEELTKGFL